MSEPREPQTPRGTRLVLVTEDADTLFFGRDEAGNRLTFEWGEPDEHGRYTPTITAHHDDNIVTEARDEGRREGLAPEDLALFEKASDFEAAWHRIIEARPRTMSLVIRVADWGPHVIYEWSGAGGNKPSRNILGPKDDPALAAFEAALRLAPQGRDTGEAVRETRRLDERLRSYNPPYPGLVVNDPDAGL